MDMTVTKAVEALKEYFDGSQVRAAKAIGVSQPTVCAWWNDGHGVSPKNARKAERATQGLVKAADLCPDLRETAA